MIIEEQVISEEDWGTIWQTFSREKPQSPAPVLGEDDNPTFDEEGVMITEMKYSDVQWLKLELANHLAKICRRGANKIKLDSAPLDQSLIDRLTKDYVGL